MKLRLGLVVLLFLPLLVRGQAETPATQVGVKFYSQAPMYVLYGAVNNGATESTTLYIKGSVEFADGAGIVQKGRTEITEDFVNGMNPDGTNANPHLFIKDKDTAEKEGVIAFIGANNKQYIKRTDKYTTKMYVDPATGVSAPGTDKPHQKTVNYIQFPTISVEKVFKYPYLGAGDDLDPRDYNYLAVDSSAAIMVDHLLVPGANRFAVEGGYSLANSSKLNMGQALIRKAVAATEAAYSQVNLKMYDYVKDSKDDGLFKADNEAASSNNTLRNSLGENYMTGFTPPFVEMGADYLFYHTLTKPSSSSFTSWEGTIVDPYYKLQAGRGYFMSMEVTDYDHVNNINPRWAHDGVLNTNRARGGFTFNRRVMEDYLRDKTVSGIADTYGNSLIGFSRFAYDRVNPSKAIDEIGTDALGRRDRHLVMENEKFVLGDVTVDLQEGFNFLGNPFMAPISLNYMLGLEHYSPASRKTYPAVADGSITIESETVGSSVDRSELFGTGVYASSVNYFSDQNTLRTKYWVINNATVKFDATDTWLHFKATYDYVSREGGATTMSIANNTYIPTPDKYLIAPMQMFGLQANKSFSIKLSPELRTFGVTRYQKSAETNSSLLKDYLVVEVVSPVEKTLDRTAVVMRDGAKLSSERDTYDTRKGISDDMETFVEVYNNKSTRTYPDPSTSIIYTKSSNGESMLGNGVPLKTKELPLYVTPPATQQTMTMNFYNLENMITVPNVWLIDKYENKTVKLTPGYSYQFTSGPSDLGDKENRFILRFWGDDEDLIGKDKEISCYYNTSILHISGLNQDDINSDVQVYDLQGRLIGRTKVNNAPSMEYLKPLSLGTYIVKITGKRNFTSKFVNLQN